MSYAAIMVHVDVDHDSDRRVQLAADLAVRFESTLIGIGGWAHGPGAIAGDVVVDGNPKDVESQDMSALLWEVERKFRANAQSIRDVEWRGTLEFPLDLVARESRAADLIIVGRQPAWSDIYHTLDPGMVLLRAGRPILVVPGFCGSLRPHRAIVAWTDTREARRAVHDALPLLRQAEEVLVVEVCHEGAGAETKRTLEDVMRYLMRNRVIVAGQEHPHAKGTLGSEILRFAKDERADLIVAGEYGHSRLSEWVFGGVTRDLLADSPVCCFLSH